jgi:hypothetical protein
MSRPSLRNRRITRIPALLAVGLSTLLVCCGCASKAMAQHTMVTMIQDDGQMLANPVGTLIELRALGASQIRIAVRWVSLAPKPQSFTRPAGFNGSDPAAYPKVRWAPYDTMVRDAKAIGISVNFNVTGDAPLWATGPGMPHGSGYPHHSWEPNATLYGQFVHALGVRYSGHYTPPGASGPLPRVTFWSIWNEPDYGPSLAPQALPGHPGVEDSPQLYRGLVDAAWSALHATGHGGDTFIWGELAPRTTGATFGDFNGMLALVFMRALYCVDSSYRELRGTAAALRGCPTTAAGSRSFAARNPALFNASGISDHPYMRWYPPNVEQPLAQPRDFRTILPDYTSLAVIGNLERATNRLVRVYGSHKVFPIWNTEFGYITSPSKHDDRYPYVSPATAAYYDNWA